MVEEYKDRLQQAMDDNKVKRQQLATVLGISYQAVRKVLLGESAGFELENHNAACAFLGVHSDWLLSGKLPKDLGEQPNVAPTDPGSRRVPLLDYVQAGLMTAPSGQGVADEAAEWLLTSSEVSGVAFALRIKGNSMEPDFREGDVVIIDPTEAPLPGDFVVAKNGEHEATFKKYRPRGISDGKEVFELVPLNEDYAPMRSDQQHIEIIGTMVEHRKYRRR